MKPFLRLIGFTSIFFVLNCYGKPLIVIDPGHEPSNPGAIGTCHKAEVVYNDELTREFVKSLSKNYQIILTRQLGKDVEIIPTHAQTTFKQKLLTRAFIANNHQAKLFISIHHDSTSSEHQLFDPSLCQLRGGKFLNPKFKDEYNIGFNIFIYDEKTPTNTEKLILSRKLAENMGEALIALGRLPSNYHIFPIDSCKSCRPINEKLGIWHEDLAVLRNTTMPAVLIEVGNIVDPQDEVQINNNKFRKRFAKAMVKAIDAYFKTNQ